MRQTPFVVAALAALAACSGPYDEQPQHVAVTASVEEITRTVLEPDGASTAIRWSAGDRIGLFTDVDMNIPYVAVSGGATTSFADEGARLQAAGGELRGYYPFAEGNADMHAVAVEAPYCRVADMAGPNVIPLYTYKGARIESGRAELRFRSLFPVLSVGLKGAGVKISRFVAEPADPDEGLVLAERCNLDLATGEMTPTASGSRIAVTLRNGAEEYITLTDTETWIDIPVAAFATSAGLRLTFYRPDGSCFVKRIWAAGGYVAEGENVCQPLKAFAEGDFSSDYAEQTTLFDFNSTSYKYRTDNSGEELYRTGPDGGEWIFRHGAPSGATAASRSLRIGYYVSCGHMGYARTDFLLDNVTRISFKAYKSNNNCSGVLLQISEDGGATWSDGESFALTLSNKSYDFYPPGGRTGSILLRFTIEMSSLTRSNADVTIDDVSVYSLIAAE